MKSHFSITKYRDIFLKNVQSFNRRDLIDPARDWLVGLLCAVVLLVAGAVYASIDFYLQFEIPKDAMEASAEPVVYRDKEVVYYANLYSEKEEVFTVLRNTRYASPIEIADIVSETDTMPEEEEVDTLADEVTAE